MLSEDDLNGIRATVGSTYPDSVWVGRATASSDGAGGSTVLWTHLLDPLPCRVQPTGGAESQVAEALRGQADFLVHLPWDCDVSPSDRLDWGDIRLEILAVDRGGELRAEVRATCKRVG